MRAKDLADAALRAWEARNMKALASYLSDGFVGRGFLPQPIRKVEYLGFIQAIMMAMPDWSFHDRLLDEGPVTKQGERVFFITQITGTHTGDLILPGLPVIPPTGTKISLWCATIQLPSFLRSVTELAASVFEAFSFFFVASKEESQSCT